MQTCRYRRSSVHACEQRERQLLLLLLLRRSRKQRAMCPTKYTQRTTGLPPNADDALCVRKQNTISVLLLQTHTCKSKLMRSRSHSRTLTLTLSLTPLYLRTNPRNIDDATTPIFLSTTPSVALSRNSRTQKKATLTRLYCRKILRKRLPSLITVLLQQQR